MKPVLELLLEKRLVADSLELPLCHWCKEEVEVEDRAGTCDTPYHRDCLIRIVVGSLGHQAKKCSCFGGREEDPPGMTARQAATVAAVSFRSLVQDLRI